MTEPRAPDNAARPLSWRRRWEPLTSNVTLMMFFTTYLVGTPLFVVTVVRQQGSLWARVSSFSDGVADDSVGTLGALLTTMIPLALIVLAPVFAPGTASRVGLGIPHRVSTLIVIGTGGVALSVLLFCLLAAASEPSRYAGRLWTASVLTATLVAVALWLGANVFGALDIRIGRARDRLHDETIIFQRLQHEQRTAPRARLSHRLAVTLIVAVVAPGGILLVAARLGRAASWIDIAIAIVLMVPCLATVALISLAAVAHLRRPAATDSLARFLSALIVLSLALFDFGAARFVAVDLGIVPAVVFGFAVAYTAVVAWAPASRLPPGFRVLSLRAGLLHFLAERSRRRIDRYLDDVELLQRQRDDS